jgi:hypothetical protein
VKSQLTNPDLTSSSCNYAQILSVTPASPSPTNPIS